MLRVREDNSSRFTPMLLIAGVYLLLTWPVVLSGIVGPQGPANDEVSYHWPTIEQFTAQFPRVDVTDYPSASAPGYYLLQSFLQSFVWHDVRLARLLSGLITLATILVVYWFAASVSPPRRALISVLPLLFLPIAIRSGHWVLADFPGLLLAFVAIGFCVFGKASPGRMLLVILFSGLLAFTRQIHLWVLVPCVAVMLMGIPWGRGGESDGRSWLYLPVAVITCAVPLLILILLVRVWGGMVPPRFQQRHGMTWNPAAITVALALVGVLGVFFLTMVGDVRRFVGRGDRSVWLAAVIGALTGLLWPTSFDMGAGRWGGPIWTLAQHLPSVGERSLLFPPLAAVGAVVLLILKRAAEEAGNGREAGLLILAFVSMTLAHAASPFAFQRYFEPVILALLAWMASLCAGPVAGWWKGPALLAGLQFILSLLTEYMTLFRVHPLG